MLHIAWDRIFGRDIPLLEIFIRGSLVYLSLLVLLRIVLKRQSGMVGIQDLLVAVLIADAAQNAMAGDYHSIPDGILLVATILFWCYTLDWLGYRFPLIQRLLRPPPLPLVENGHLLRRNMRLELITEEELMSMLRQQGIEDLNEVKSACMEGDGRLSVIPCAAPRRNNHHARRVV
ncbi:MAG: DUF421 domain-containing protein [Isosphaeraceae bacterium]|nr:DUF421 domain-containing protein [Isosphaeraceae bacterium]